MRREIYEALKERLLSRLKEVNGERMVLMSDTEAAVYVDRESSIKHVALWNQNVVFIEQDEPWGRPAVFVEFAPIDWSCVHGRSEYTTRSRLVLHVVTDWTDGDSSCLSAFDLVNDIHTVLEDFSGECFDHLHLVGSQTNHDHEELLENLEIYEYRGSKQVGLQ